jgi:hypothetical protein
MEERTVESQTRDRGLAVGVQYGIRHRAKTERALLLLAALVLVGGAACSNGGDGDDRAETESLNSSQPEGGGDDAATGNEGNEPASTGSDEVLGTTRAERTSGSNDQRGVPLRIDVIRLERNGELVELALRLTNQAEPPSDGSEPLGFGLSDNFGDGHGLNARFDVSGIGLVDGEQQMLYLPADDSEGNCLCTWVGSGDSTRVLAGESLTLEATIGGVPEGVEQVDVRIPGFPTVSGVAVQ